MPSIITRGVASALAFGFGGGVPKTLTTETFTANGTWVAPVGVGMVAVLSGKGSAGVSDYTTARNLQYFANRSTGSYPNPPFANWSTLYSDQQNEIAALNAFGPYPKYGNGYISNYVSILTGNTTTNYWLYQPFTSELFVGKIMTGTITPGATAPSSGNIDFTTLTVSLGFTIAVGYIEDGGPGTAATALGQTFPGGTYTGTYPNAVGNPAVTTTYTNISVTPGTSYSIVVPSGGQVQISYFV